MKILFDYFWNSISPFSKFALSVFQDSPSHTVLFVFWMILMETVNAPAGWCPWACLKSVSGLGKLEKTWFFRNAHNSLTWYSNIVQTLTKETGYGFSLLPFIDEYSCLDYWNEYFFFCVSVFTLKFSQIAFFRKCVQVDSGTDWIRNGLFLGFFLGRWLFSLALYLYGLKPAWYAETCYFNDIKSFGNFFGGYLILPPNF